MMNVVLNSDRTRKTVVSVNEVTARSSECPINILPDDIFIVDAPPIPDGIYTPQLLTDWEVMLLADHTAIVWVEANQAARDDEQLAQQVELKNTAISTGMDTALAAGFACSNGITMDAMNEDISNLDRGWRLAPRLGKTNMDVRDFHNARHLGIALADVEAMINELGENWIAQWSRKCELQEQVSAIKARAQLPPADPGYLSHTAATAELKLIKW